MFGEAILMSTHNICFYGEISKIIPYLSYHQISSLSVPLCEKILRIVRLYDKELISSKDQRYPLNNNSQYTMAIASDSFLAGLIPMSIIFIVICFCQLVYRHLPCKFYFLICFKAFTITNLCHYATCTKKMEC